MFKAHNHESGSANHWWSSYRLMAPPADWLEPHPFFKRAMDQLPENIGSAADHKKYTDLLTRFGTHYVYESNFGARVSMDSFVSSDTVKQHSESWKKREITASISYSVFELGITDAKEKKDIKVDEDYKNNSETIVYYEGGDPNLQKDDKQAEWVQSIYDFPAFLNVTVAGIDTMFEGKKAANVQTLAQAYMSSGEVPSYAQWNGPNEYQPAEKLFHAQRALAMPAEFWARPTMVKRAIAKLE